MSPTSLPGLVCIFSWESFQYQVTQFRPTQHSWTPQWNHYAERQLQNVALLLHNHSCDLVFTDFVYLSLQIIWKCPFRKKISILNWIEKHLVADTSNIVGWFYENLKDYNFQFHQFISVLILKYRIRKRPMEATHLLNFTKSCFLYLFPKELMFLVKMETTSLYTSWRC